MVTLSPTGEFLDTGKGDCDRSKKSCVGMVFKQRLISDVGCQGLDGAMSTRCYAQAFRCLFDIGDIQRDEFGGNEARLPPQQY
ncbi:MAG: hypothetical protein OJF62_000711 [Pseudolabrys sp.]|jgi:hypothetical protein|nr:hypothetical protein [Pseudolabrys sp.]